MRKRISQCVREETTLNNGTTSSNQIMPNPLVSTEWSYNQISVLMTADELRNMCYKRVPLRTVIDIKQNVQTRVPFTRHTAVTWYLRKSSADKQKARGVHALASQAYL